MTHRRLPIYKTEVVSSCGVTANAALNPAFSFPLDVFNLPEYFLIRRGLKPAIIQWYPDLFVLARDNWRPLISSQKEITTQSIDRGKIYRISGISTRDLLSDISRIWTKNALCHISRLQIFSDICDYDEIHESGGRIVHTLRLLRKPCTKK
jgi:hypothetical protein